MNRQPTSRKGVHGRAARVMLAAMAALLLRAALDFTYVNYVDKFFHESLSAGVFAFTGIGTLRLLESYVIALILSIWLAASLYRRWRPSGIALLLYFVFVILPLSSLYGLTDAPASFVYTAAGSFALLIVVTGLLPEAKVPRPGHDLVYLGLTAVLGICVYVYGWLVLTGGLGRLNFDLLSVYEVRVEYVQRQGPFLGYFIPWQANVINILILCYGLHKRNLWLLGIAGVAQLLLFGMTGHKSFLLSPVLAVGVYFIWRRRNALFYIFAGASVLVLASYVLFLATNNHLPSSLLIRRLFFVPAANHLIYYDFFSQPENPFVMLSDSVLEPFVRYPYDTPVTRVISWAYWGRDFSPNVGYLGDAFAHFGFTGMFLFSIILGLFLRVVDSVGSRLPTNLVAAVMATPAMALTNSALFTSLLTHGLIPAVVLLWLLRFVVERRSRPGEVKGIQARLQQQRGAPGSCPQ
jgi:hypothetical protein